MRHQKFFYTPSTVAEKRAMSLERHLENMLRLEGKLTRDLKFMRRKKKNTKKLEERLTDVRKGVNEVFQKACSAWSKVE